MKNSLVKLAVRFFGSAFILILACYLAYAYSTGITGQTKKNSQTAGCGAKVSGGGGCHGTSPDTNIEVLLSGPSVLPVGASGTYTISLTGATSAGGGCDIAVSSGTLSATSTFLQLLNQELTHVSPIATPYSIEFTYVSNSPGTVTMYANGKASSGWNWAPNLSIRIGPPPAPSLVQPADGTPASPTSLALVWSGIQGPLWSIEVSASQSFGSFLVRQDSLSDTTYMIPEGILANNTQYYWRVSASDSGGTSAWSPAWSFTTALTGVDGVSGALPKEFLVEQNYPNPFNPKTGVRFSVPSSTGRDLVSTSGEDGQVPGVREAGTGGSQPASGLAGGLGAWVKLAVYDMLGREVAVLVNERKAPGTYEVAFDGSRLSSGIYIYRLTAGSFVQSRKMVLVK